MSHAVSLTLTQKIALCELDRGILRGRSWPKGQARAAWERMMKKLVAHGYAVEGDRYGDWFTITTAGREAARWLIADAEARAAAALGDANEARARGAIAQAERLLARSQRALDEANDLRGWGGVGPQHG